MKFLRKCVKVKIPVWAAGLGYRDRRGSSKKRAEDDEFKFFRRFNKKKSLRWKIHFGLQSQETIHHESSFYFIIQLNLIELRTESLTRRQPDN